MRVALVNTHYVPDLQGGAERSLQILAEGLVGRGVDVSVICLAAGADPGGANIGGVRVVYLPMPELRWRLAPDRRYPWRGLPGWSKPVWHLRESWNPAMYRRLGAALDDLRPDLVHTNNLLGLSAWCWRAVRLRGLPLVHTLRDYQLLCPRGQMMRGERRCERQCSTCRLYAKPRQLASRRVDAVVGNSRFVLERHLRQGFFTDTEVRRTVYDACEPSGPPRATNRQIPDLPLRLGYLGKLIPAKGLLRLLETLAPALRDGQVQLIVGGDGPAGYERELCDAGAIEGVFYLGWVRPEAVLQQVHALVVPSLWEEPLSRTVFEAYCHGVPVIASLRGGNAEVIDAGVTGFCYDPDRPAELLAVVSGLLADPASRSRLARGAAAAAVRFAPQRVVDDYQRLYSELIDP